MRPSAVSRAPRDPRWKSRVLASLGLVGATAAVGMLAATQSYYESHAEGETITWGGMLVRQLIHWGVWAAFLPLIVGLTRRVSRVGGLWAQVAIQAALAAVVCVIQALTVVTIRTVFFLPREPIVAYIRGWFVFDMVTYAALVAGVLAVEHWRTGRGHALRAAQLDVELSRAQLRALQMQLHPHFLFNTLNTVAMLIRTSDGPRALTMIAGLGDMLRQILREPSSHEVPLAEELAFLEQYLGIERVRFHDRLQVTIDVPSEAGDAQVPRFVLQPLVENAIRHGVEKRAGRGRVSISAFRANGTLSVVVQDDGPGLSAGGGSGVGLRNTRERLRHLYGDAGGLSLAPAADGGTVATVALPWHTVPLAGGAAE